MLFSAKGTQISERRWSSPLDEETATQAPPSTILRPPTVILSYVIEFSTLISDLSEMVGGKFPSGCSYRRLW